MMVPAPLELPNVPCAAKLADSVCVPTLKTPKLKIAGPLVSAIVTGVPPSTLRVTLPVTVPPGEVTDTLALPLVP